MKKDVICLIGDSGAGKGAIGEMLAEDGYQIFSLSGEVRRCAHCRQIQDPTRQDLQLLATELRTIYGPRHFARQLLRNPELNSASNVVIDGARNVAELTVLKAYAQKKGWELTICYVTADADIRFDRILRRGRPSDPKTRKQFDINDAREKGVGGTIYSQQNELCRQMADITIVNNFSTREELRREVDHVFSLNGTSIESFHPPSKERY